MEQFDLKEMQIKIEKIKEKIHELANDPLRENLKEFYMMGLITPLLDELLLEDCLTN